MTAPRGPGPGTLSSAELSRLSDRLGTLLLIGVALAATFLLAGVVVAAAQSGGSAFSPSSLGPIRFDPSGLAAEGEAGELIAVGLVLLVATPVARVLLSLEAFARARETDYVLLLVLVLAILGVSALVGLLA